MQQWYSAPPGMGIDDERRTEERNSIRRLANRCGLVMLLLLLGMYVVSFGLSFLGANYWKALPGWFTNNFSFSDTANLLLNLIFYLGIIPLLLWYCNRQSKTRLSEYLRFPAMPKKAVWKLVLMGFGVVWAASEAGSFVYMGINSLLEMLFHFQMNTPDVTVDRNPISIAVLVLGSAILAPFFEELFARCGLVGTLRAHGGVFTAIATGVMFGFMHTNFQQVFFAAMMGIYAGFVTYRTRSVWPAILLHFMVNGISVLQSIALSFTDINGITYQEIEYLMRVDPQYLLSQLVPMGMVSLLSLLFLTFGVTGLVVFIKTLIKYPQEFSLPDERRHSLLRTRDKCKIFFASPAIIVFLIFSVLLSCMNAFIG